jgi:hypothetical protein
MMSGEREWLSRWNFGDETSRIAKFIAHPQIAGSLANIEITEIFGIAASLSFEASAVPSSKAITHR